MIFEAFPLRENMNYYMRIMLKGSSDAGSVVEARSMTSNKRLIFYFDKLEELIFLLI